MLPVYICKLCRRQTCYPASKSTYTLPPFPARFEPWMQNKFLAHRRELLLAQIETEVDAELRAVLTRARKHSVFQ